MRDGEFLAEVTGWAHGVSGRADLELVEFRQEAWSTIWRTQGSGAALWLKASTSANPAEGSVHHLLSQVATDQVRAPVGWDDGRGWLLTRDGGRTVFDADPGVRGLTGTVAADLLDSYATLQRATVGRRDEFVAAGLPDGSPTDSAGLLLSCVQEMAAVPKEDPRHLTDDEAAALVGVAPELQAIGEALTAGPVPLAFDHNDLFPRNVFEARPGYGYHFFDFAESVWAHPFGSLLMLLWELMHRAGIDAGETGVLDLRDGRIGSVFDSYLSRWTDYGSLDELRQLAGWALRIAPLYRASTWLEVLRKVPTAVEKHGKTPRAWIFDVLRPVAL